MRSTIEALSGLGLWMGEWLKIALWLIVTVAILLCLMAGLAILTAKRKTACEAAGGHFITQPFTADECWSSDGRRMFPEGM